MDSRLCHAIAVVFNDVHLHARRLVDALDVALIGRLELTSVRGCRIQVVVHTTLGARGVHVKLYVAAVQIPSGLAVNATAALDGPAVSMP